MSFPNLNVGPKTPVPDRQQQRNVLIATVLSNLFTSFSLSGINVAVPVIQKSLGLSAALVGWVALSFTLSAGAAIAPVARFADIWGQKRAFMLGLIIFLITSMICALAQGPVVLMAGRVLMGLGGAFIFTSTMSLATAVFPPGERGKALGFNMSAVYLGLSLGPGFCGLLTATLGWRSIFWGPALGLVVPLLALSRLKGQWAVAKGEDFDFIGSTLWILFLVPLFWGLTFVYQRTGLLMVGLGGLFGLAFVKWQLKSARPILNVRLFQNRGFALANLAAFISYSAATGAVFLVNLYFQYIKGLPPVKTGLLLMITPISQSILTPMFGRLSDRVDPGFMASLGMIIVVIAMVMLSVGSQPDTSLLYTMASLLIFGAGFALFIAPNTNAIMGSVDKKFIGQASGLIAASRLCGQMCSFALVTLSLSMFVGPVKLSLEHREHLLSAFHFCFYIFIGACTVAAIASWARNAKADK